MSPRFPAGDAAAGAASQRSRRKQLILFLGGMLVGAVLGAAVARLLPELLLPTGGRRWLKIALLATVPLLWWAVVAWHELGHVLGGKLVGGRFQLLAVGPWLWQRGESGWRWRWQPRLNPMGGLALCAPAGTHDLPRRTAVMVAGGPLASLVGGGLLAAAAVALAGASGESERLPALQVWGQHALTLAALLSALVFFTSAFPFEAGGFKSDGRRLVGLWRRGPAREQEAAMLALTAASLAGVRPRDYDPALLRRATRLGDGSLFDLQGSLLAYYHAADRRQPGEAQRYLDRALAGEARLAPFQREIVRAEYAWLLARFAPGADAAAEAWLRVAGKVALHPAARERAAAAILWARGEADAARTAARRGLEALAQRSLAPTKSAWEEDELTALLTDPPPARRPEAAG